MHQKDPLEGDFDTKGGWGQTNKVTKNSYFVPFLLKFSSLSLFLTSVSLFSTSPTVHTIDFCWLALFLFLQKHVFMNKTPTHSWQNNSSHHSAATLTVFVGNVLI